MSKPNHSESIPSNQNDLSEEEWKHHLTPEQYSIARKGGTERAFTGKFWNHKEKGIYNQMLEKMKKKIYKT